MIRIKTNDLNEIISHCKDQLPLEACGILAGTNEEANGVKVKTVLSTHPCVNVLKSSTEYKIDPEEQFKVFSEIEEAGLDLVGFYHSHPQGPAKPSALDKTRANYQGYSYVFIALHPIHISSWILVTEGVFTEEELQVVNEV